MLFRVTSAFIRAWTFRISFIQLFSIFGIFTDSRFQGAYRSKSRNLRFAQTGFSQRGRRLLCDFRGFIIASRRILSERGFFWLRKLIFSVYQNRVRQVSRFRPGQGFSRVFLRFLHACFPLYAFTADPLRGLSFFPYKEILPRLPPFMATFLHCVKDFA